MSLLPTDVLQELSGVSAPPSSSASSSDRAQRLESVLMRARKFERDARVSRPTKDNWLEAAKKRAPEADLEAELVRRTRPVVHEKVLELANDFLNFKKANGNSVEKKVYEGMGVLGLIDRLIKKVRIPFVLLSDSINFIFFTASAGVLPSVRRLHPP